MRKSIRYLASLWVCTLYVAAAPLQDLEKSVVAQTAFENVTTAYHSDRHTSGNVLDDSIDENVPLGFNFTFGGIVYTHVNIDSNGNISFDNSITPAYNNAHLPYGDRHDTITAYWDDLNPGSGGSIKYGTRGSGSNKHFVVSWNSVPHYPSSGAYSFQVVLYKSGAIRFRYDSSSSVNGSSATVGVQEDSSHYDEHSYNSTATFDATKDVLYTIKATVPPVDYGYSEWHFDEASWNGTSGEVKDSHSNKHGTGHNVVAVEGKVCNAADLRVSSATDYMSLPKAALDGATNFTISVWHKGSSSSGRAILSGAGSNSDNELIYWFNNSTTFNPYLRSGQPSINISNINNNTWQHLVWRRRGDTTCLYQNGQEKDCKIGNAPRALNIGAIILGQEQDNVGGGFSASQDWEGILDELIIFKRALSNSEITSIYNNQNAGKNWNGTSRPCPHKLTMGKLSMAKSDPINMTNGAKRIPGAIIRYCFTVDNEGPSDVSNAKIDDALTGNGRDNLEYLASGKVIQNINTDCDCAAITDTSGAISGTDITINLGNIKHKATDPAHARACAYIEAKIK